MKPQPKQPAFEHLVVTNPNTGRSFDIMPFLNVLENDIPLSDGETMIENVSEFIDENIEFGNEFIPLEFKNSKYVLRTLKKMFSEITELKPSK